MIHKCLAVSWWSKEVLSVKGGACLTGDLTARIDVTFFGLELSGLLRILYSFSGCPLAQHSSGFQEG